MPRKLSPREAGRVITAREKLKKISKPAASGQEAQEIALTASLAGYTKTTVNKSQAAYDLRAKFRYTWAAIARMLDLSQPNAVGMARRYAESRKLPWPIEILGDATVVTGTELAAVEKARKKMAKKLKP